MNRRFKRTDDAAAYTPVSGSTLAKARCPICRDVLEANVHRAPTLDFVGEFDEPLDRVLAEVYIGDHTHLVELISVVGDDETLNKMSELLRAHELGYDLVNPWPEAQDSPKAKAKAKKPAASCDDDGDW